MPAYYGCFRIRKCFHLLSDGGEKYVLAEGQDGRRRARLLLHTQREGTSRPREEGVRHAGRTRFVSEKLQAFYVRTREA